MIEVIVMADGTWHLVVCRVPNMPTPHVVLRQFATVPEHYDREGYLILRGGRIDHDLRFVNDLAKLDMGPPRLLEVNFAYRKVYVLARSGDWDYCISGAMTCPKCLVPQIDKPQKHTPECDMEAAFEALRKRDAKS